MYKNTVYIFTITSWLHSQWQKLHRHKNRIVSLHSQQFSSRRRTSNKNNTEYRTSVQKITLLYQKTKKTLKRNKHSETIFHSNRSHWSRHSGLLKPKFQNNKFNLILDIFFYKTDVTQTATLHCNGILILKQSQ